MLNSHRIADRLARGTRGAVLCCLLAATPTVAQDPFADAVAAFTPGTNAGFGADEPKRLWPNARHDDKVAVS